MKLLLHFVLLLLCIESLHCSDDAAAVKPNSIETFFAQLKQVGVQKELTLKAIEHFVKEKFKKLEEQRIADVQRVQKEKIRALEKKDQESEFGLFTRSSCTIRGEVDDVFKEFVNDHCKTLDTKPDPIEVLPEVIEGQVYEKSHETFLFGSYPLWLSFINTNRSSLAVCFRDKLSEYNHANEQLAWSAPKLYKFYNRYHHVSDSAAIVTYDKYLLIKSRLRKGQCPKFPALETKEELELYLNMTIYGKTFFDLLEEKNQWFITSEDCKMLNLIKDCKHKAEFECRPFKKSPILVVPLLKDGHAEFYEDCTGYI